MYNIEYFRDRVDVEEHDYRVSEDGFFKLLERIATDHIQYTLSGVFDSVQEMEKDLNDHASTFFNTVYDEYQDYAAEIVRLIDSISSELPEFIEGESIADYVSRMCVNKAM
jgi:hypothetical protein